MENVFQQLGDVLNPNPDQKLIDRAEAFNDIVKVMEQVKDPEDRLKLYLALRNYIACD
jgi:hypothetical protein